MCVALDYIVTILLQGKVYNTKQSETLKWDSVFNQFTLVKVSLICYRATADKISISNGN